MYKQSSEYKSIQKKLVAAVAMVLVACIMVVSSSYAWFTLSTAPEVKGITTSVGSNGNLEMALITTGLSDIGTTQDYVDFPTANNYWGNLVDLTDESYHLSDIALAPARLNANVLRTSYNNKTVTLTGLDNKTDYEAGGKYTEDGVEYEIATVTYSEADENSKYTATITYKVPLYTYAVDSNSWLKTAVYGTDGRISALQANTYMGTYATIDERSAFYANSAYGVRVVGTSSGLTPEQIALREAVQTVSSAKNTAIGLAQASLTNDSVKLAGIMVDIKLNEKTTVSETDFNNVVTAVEKLQTVVNTLQTAVTATINAVGVSQGITVSNITYGTDAITAGDGTNNISWNNLIPLQSELIAANARITEMNTKLTAAATTLNGATQNTDTTYDYKVVENAMKDILSASDMTLNGTALSGDMDAIQNAVINAFLDNGYLPFEIVGGIYCYIAEFCDNYSATTTMTVTSSKLTSILGKESITTTVVMVTKADAPVNETSFYLPYFVSSISSLTIEGGETDSTVISDYYAYAIDLAFRTNAADSYLKLQTSATSRVGDDTTAAVQGSGSYMQFTLSENSTTNGYTMAQMVELMKAIRVVLMDYETGEIYGLAILDMTATDLGDVDELTEGTQYDYVDSADKAYKLTNATVTNGTTIKANLYLCDYSISDTGVLTVKENSLYSEANANICELTQNVAAGITSLVYLDGDLVDNGDVAINGDSMTGTMNLQFSSSATLEPMDYTFTETTNGTLATPTYELSNDGVLTVKAVEHATTYTVSYNGADVYSSANVGTVNLADHFTTLNATAGTYELTLTASATGYTSSSTTISYKYEPAENPSEGG